MGFKTGAWATIWRFADSAYENQERVQISISRKDKDGNFVKDFSDFVTFYNAAAKVVGSLPERSRIKLGAVDVSNSYNKETGKSFVNYKVFSIEQYSNNGEHDSDNGEHTASSTKSSAKKEEVPKSALDDTEDETDEDDLPF